MATTNVFQAEEAKDVRPSISPEGAGKVFAVRGEYDLAAALILDDVIEMVKLPADCVPVDAILDTDDLDTNATPLITLDAGIMSGTPGDANIARTVGTELFAASTVGQAGGVVRPSAVTAFRVAPASADRSVGILVKAAPATGAATGKIGFTLLYRAARAGE